MKTKIIIKIMVLATACIAGSISVFAQSGGIGTSQWGLVRAGGVNYPNSTAYFELDDQGKRFSGNTGCNRMNGEFWRNGQRIGFSKIATTKMMCKLPAGSLPELAFTRHLQNAYRYQKTGNSLRFLDRRGRMILEFRRSVKLPPQDPGDSVPSTAALENRRWVLESIGTRETFKSIEGAFINFDKVKHSVGGSSGCNSFGGEYKTFKSAIEITDVISTMMACTEGDKMAVERGFFDGLRQATRYEIENQRLRLYRGNNLLLTFRPELK